jgi:hypothetical protein
MVVVCVAEPWAGLTADRGAAAVPDQERDALGAGQEPLPAPDVEDLALAA